MKLKKISFLIGLLFTLNLFGQGTTWEEYNYVTKGMPEQINKGLDVYKKGYIYKELGAVKFGGYSFYFGDLIRTSSNKPACTIVRIGPVTYKKEGFFCIPALGTSNDVYSAAMDGIIKHFQGSERGYLVQALSYLYMIEKYE